LKVDNKHVVQITGIHKKSEVALNLNIGRRPRSEYESSNTLEKNRCVFLFYH